LSGIDIDAILRGASDPATSLEALALAATFKEDRLPPFVVGILAEDAGGSNRSPLVRATLEPLLSDESAYVREGAVLGLYAHLDPPLTETIGAISKSDPSIAVRMVALFAIAPIDKPLPATPPMVFPRGLEPIPHADLDALQKIVGHSPTGSDVDRMIGAHCALPTLLTEIGELRQELLWATLDRAILRARAAHDRRRIAIARRGHDDQMQERSLRAFLAEAAANLGRCVREGPTCLEIEDGRPCTFCILTRALAAEGPT